MARSRRQLLLLALLIVLGGCNSAANQDLVVTPAPIPIDQPTIALGEQVVVELSNRRVSAVGLSVTLVEGDLSLVEVTWTNGTTTGVDLNAAGRDRIRQRVADGDVKSIDLPDDIKSSYAFEPAEPGTTATLALRGGDLNPTVLIEVRPVDGVASVLGDREPLIDAVVIDCGRAERFESVHLVLRANVDFNRSRACVPAE